MTTGSRAPTISRSAVSDGAIPEPRVPTFPGNGEYGRRTEDSPERVRMRPDRLVDLQHTAGMTELRISGIDRAALQHALDVGIDHGGNPIEPFTDPDGGWPMRCCLADSAPGDRIAIIAWSPFPWSGAYAETGPVVVHTEGCPEVDATGSLPDDMNVRAMTLRPYNNDQMIAYGSVRHVSEGEGLSGHLRELLADPAITMVHARNITGGCYAFTATRPNDN